MRQYRTPEQLRSMTDADLAHHIEIATHDDDGVTSSVREALVRLLRRNQQPATQEQIFAAHAEFGRLDKKGVKKAMGPNWPREWDYRHPDIFDR